MEEKQSNSTRQVDWPQKADGGVPQVMPTVQLDQRHCIASD